MVTYILIIGVAFYVIATSLIQLVGDYLCTLRVQEQQRISEELAISAAPLLDAHDGRLLYDAVVEASREYGGRALVLDAYGTVQADAFSRLNGSRLGHPEVVAVLSGGQSSAYSFYKEEMSGAGWLLSMLGVVDDSSVYGLYASSIVSGDRIIGVTLYSSSEQELYGRLLFMQRQIVGCCWAWRWRLCLPCCCCRAW